VSPEGKRCNDLLFNGCIRERDRVMEWIKQKKNGEKDENT
jgi:hypothetical protein